MPLKNEIDEQAMEDLHQIHGDPFEAWGVVEDEQRGHGTVADQLGTADVLPAPTADLAAPGVPNVASVPFLITASMRARLKSLGLSDAEVDRLNPIEAWEILKRE